MWYWEDVDIDQGNGMTIKQITESNQAQEVLDIVRNATRHSEFEGKLYMAGGYVSWAQQVH